jgi:uncharacterized membrane protein
MSNFPNANPFKRGVVEPVYCFKAGWDLVKDQYWLLVGMTFVTYFLGGMVPFGIILGPLMCGLYMALFRRRRGEFFEFGILFKGFDYFGDSVVATLIHYVPMVLIVLPFYVVLYAGMFLILPRQGSGEVDPSILSTWIAVMVVLGLVMMVLIIFLSIMFMFSYPLIVDRKMSGIEAAKLSARAGLANFWSLLGLLLLNGLMFIGGLLLCYVGLFLVLPISFGAIAVAYEQVFGLGEGQGPILPPPPPIFT